MAICKLLYLLKMVIFHSYVSLPKGTSPCYDHPNDVSARPLEVGDKGDIG